MTTIYTLKTIQDLKDRLRHVDISDEVEAFAIEIGRRLPNLFHTGRKRGAIAALMVSSGYEIEQSETMVASLLAVEVLFKSASSNTIAFHPFKPTKRKGTRGRCVYCSKMTNNITKDHVIPKGQWGSDSPDNIVLACQPCNLSKGCRTPEEWARDILSHDKPRKPMRRLPLRLRARLVLSSAASFIAALFAIGGAK